MSTMFDEFLNDVTNYIPHIAHKWDFIGIKLYQSSLVSQLRHTEKSASQKLTEIIQTWLKGANGPQDELKAWEVLVGVLDSKAVCLGAMARKIRETHVNSLKKMVSSGGSRQAMVIGRLDSGAYDRSAHDDYRRNQLYHSTVEGLSHYSVKDQTPHDSQVLNSPPLQRQEEEQQRGQSQQQTHTQQQQQPPQHQPSLQQQQQTPQRQPSLQQQQQPPQHQPSLQQHQQPPQHQPSLQQHQQPPQLQPPQLQPPPQQQPSPYQQQPQPCLQQRQQQNRYPSSPDHSQIQSHVSSPVSAQQGKGYSSFVTGISGPKIPPPFNNRDFPHPFSTQPLYRANTPTNSLQPSSFVPLHPDSQYNSLSDTSVPDGFGNGEIPTNMSMASYQESSLGKFPSEPPSQEIVEMLQRRMNLDDKDDRDCLLRLAERIPRWKELAVKLGLPMSQISAIGANHESDYGTKATDVLFAWVEASTTGTRQTLVQVLKESKLNHVALELYTTGAIQCREDIVR